MLTEARIIELKQNIFDVNQVNADKIREKMRAEKKLMINVMSSPGSGKTTTLTRTIRALKDEFKVGVLECDIDASVDAETILQAGAKSVQLHTGGMCHMDAQMTWQGMDAIGMDDIDLCFIENVGNLVCPAEFDTGADINMTILSVPEGDDKPVKYPLMYEVSELVLVNKIDALSVFDFDQDLVVERIHALNPDAEVIFVSSKTGEGFDIWLNWLRHRLKKRMSA